MSACRSAATTIATASRSRYSLDPAIEAEAPTLDLRQTRVDGRAEIDTGGGFVDLIRFRGGWSDYRHFEIEDTGEIATTFRTEGVEGRLEAVQANRGGWGGGFGVQYFNRDFSVVGDEKFLPANRDSQIGLFVLQTFDLGAVRARGRARATSIRGCAPTRMPIIGNPALCRVPSTPFPARSAAMSSSRRGIRLGLNAVAQPARALGRGIVRQRPARRHPGVRDRQSRFRQGAQLGRWKATLRCDRRRLQPVRRRSSTAGSTITSTSSRPARSRTTCRSSNISRPTPAISASSWKARCASARIGGTTINLDGVADYVRATIDTVGPAPRIPPFRLLAGVEAQSGIVDGRLEVEHVTGQDRVAAFETTTPGYTMVNASLAVHPFGEANGSSITLSANNIFDVTARRHASVLKDYAPLAGRDIRITARFTF